MERLVNLTPTAQLTPPDANDWSVFGIFMLMLHVQTLILILTLNPLCLVGIQRVASIQPTTKIFLISLIVSDFCNGLLILPVDIVALIVGRRPLDNLPCILYSILHCLLFLQCFVSLLLLTVDRYLAIAWCLHYPRLMTVHRSKIIVLCRVWGSVLLVSAIGKTLFSKFRISIELGCISEENLMLFYTLIGFILFGLLMIVTLYMHILVIARRQARRIAQENQPVEGPNAPQRISKKSFSTVSTVMAIVVIGWLPVVMEWLLHSGNVGVNVSMDVHNSVAVLYYTTNWIDVAIFCLRTKEFRDTLRKMARACCGTLHMHA